MGALLKQGERLARYGLLTLNLFLGMTAVLGGAALLLGWHTPELAMLEGSPFDSYIIPGLALLVVVGGSGFLAAALMLRWPGWGAFASGVAAAAILTFEGVEVAVMGYQHWLQGLYFAVGAAIAALALLYWRIGARPVPHRPRTVAHPGMV